MTAQEQAFRDYYGSMADAELLRTALHRKSYIELAQRLMSEEIERRHLKMPDEEHSARKTTPGFLEKFAAKFSHRSH